MNRSPVMRLLGAWLDNQLKFNHHVTQKCHMAMWSLLRIKNICKYLDKDACEMPVKNLFLIYLDYSNTMLINSHDCVIDKLDWIQNVDDKMILNLQRSNSATEARKTLHWLPIWARVEFKILLLVYKCLNNSV